jgi:3-oxoacyl-[acyl-carrier protein] reductase
MKRALVTGGSGEIGAAICHRLARAGMDVLVHASSRPERAHTLATEIVADGPSYSMSRTHRGRPRRSANWLPRHRFRC